MATTPKGPPPTIDLLSENLFRVVSVILIFVACLLIAGLVIQTRSYYGGLKAATAVSATPAETNPPADLVDHAAIITYARGLGAAFVKTSALFLGFILIFTGTLYVLRMAEASYQLHLSSGKIQGSLQTASPGLVIVTLGVLLTIVTLTTKSDLDYQKTTQTKNQPAAQSLDPSNTPKQGAWSQAPAEPGTAGTQVKTSSQR